MRPKIEQREGEDFLRTKHDVLEPFLFDIHPDEDGHPPEILFTDNQTNVKRLYQMENPSPYVKDAFHEYIIHQRADAVNPKRKGTKVGLYYRLKVQGNASTRLHLRLHRAKEDGSPASKLDVSKIDQLFQQRIDEANEFYSIVLNPKLNDDERNIVRQAYAGLLYTKQFYHYIVEDWIEGDPDIMRSSENRRNSARNKDWPHL